MQQEVNGFLSNPTADGVLRLSAMMPPEQAKSVREGWAALGEDKASKSLSQVTQIASALLSDTPKVGIDMLNEAAAGARNAGNEQLAVQYETYAKTAEQNPRFAALTALVPTTGTEAGRNALESLIGVQKAPAEIREGEAKATKAETEAKYAELTALQGVELQKWQTNQIKNDIALSKENQRLRAMEARTASMNAGLERDKLLLQYQSAKEAFDNKLADRAAEAQSVYIGISNVRDSVAALRSHPGFSSLFGASWTPGARFIPGSDTAGAEAFLLQLKSRAFLVGLEKMRGLGALGEKEGAKIEADLASLTPGMPEKDAIAVLDSIEASMDKLDAIRRRKYGDTEFDMSPSTPKVGAVIDGYVFLGGDPANPASWRKQ
jgi:hypothetical protein